jgi:hypothetical protein
VQLWKYLLPVHQSISTYGTSALIMYCTKNRAQELEEKAKSNSTVADYINKIKELSSSMTNKIEDYSIAIDLKNLFSEALMYVRLSELGSIEKIPESDYKSPDFKFTTSKNSIFIENKALNMSGGNVIHNDIMQDGFKNKLELEKKLKSKKQAVIKEQVVQPYIYSSNEKYDKFSTRLVTETLINKVSQNLKKDQFNHGQTILLIDFSGQLLLHDSASDHSKKTFINQDTHSEVSGELWYLAFGKKDDQMFKHIEFEGLSNDDGKLQTSGLLNSHDYIKGIIVHYEDTFWGFVLNKNGSRDINECLNLICKNVKRI